MNASKKGDPEVGIICEKLLNKYKRQSGTFSKQMEHLSKGIKDEKEILDLKITEKKNSFGRVNSRTDMTDEGVGGPEGRAIEMKKAPVKTGILKTKALALAKVQGGKKMQRLINNESNIPKFDERHKSTDSRSMG
jgi:hypothetical protein